MASAASTWIGDVAFTTPPNRSFAELRPPAIHFRRFRELPRERIDTNQLMGFAGDRASAAPISQLEPRLPCGE